MQHHLTEHEWVTDFSEFEAVLVCANDLDSFDTGVCLRAYQTFKWDEASTPGNDLSFRHESTGALVRHDGLVVAIDALHDDPIEPLHDLFRVLHALGWKKAVVYHPVESMALMLRDMGKAIPAQLDFDIQAAEEVTRISGFAESKALVSRGQEILKNNREAVLNSSLIIMDELESITSEIMEDNGVQSVSAAVTASSDSLVLPGGAFQEFELDDDEPQKAENVGEYVAEVHRAPAHAVALDEGAADFGFFRPLDVSAEGVSESLMSLASFENEDDELSRVVLENERLREELAASQDVRWQLARSSANVQADAENIEKELRSNIRSLELALSEAVEREELAGEAALRDGVIRENLMNEVIELRNQIDQGKERSIVESNVIKIGASAICFDFPETPLDVTASNHLAADYGEVVHLHVGAIGQNVRWDVLGEISAQFPWEAEKLAYGMKFHDEHCTLVASIFLDLKAKIPQAQFRDVLRGFDETDKLPTVNLNTLASRLRPLALCAEGQAFVDIRSDAEGADGLDIFTVRGLLDSFATKLFVVHVDALDGPFVRWIADLLRFVAIGYEMTARYKAVEMEAAVSVVDAVGFHVDVDLETEEVRREVQEEDSFVDQKEKMLNELNVVLGDFVQGLQRLGIGTAAGVGG